MISTAQSKAGCNETFNLIETKSKTSPLIIKHDEMVQSNTNAKSEDISLQKRQSWFDGSLITTRTTPSNSTEMQVISQQLDLNSIIQNINESQQREGISVQNAVFSEEDLSSQASQSQSQDLTPFFSLLKKDINNRNILRQHEGWNSQQLNFINIEQNTQKDALGLLDEKILLNVDVKSENFILECQSAQELNTNVQQQEVSSLVMEEIKKLEEQENEDETQSPTLKLRRVKAGKDNTIEDRIYRWLDIHGIIQVDPSQKREEYYQTKRETLIQMKKVSKPLEEDMKQSSGSLNLCKISSSPLFNRRKQNNKESKNKVFHEINSDVGDQNANTNMNTSELSNSGQNQNEDIQQSQYSQKSKFQNLKIKSQQNQKTNTEYSSEKHESLQNKIILQVPSKNQIYQEFGQSPSYSNIYSTCKEESVKTIEEELNNILPNQNIKLLSITSIKSIQETSTNQSNYIDKKFALNMAEKIQQENFDYINNKPPPNLDIQKNQKRRSMKNQNSIPQLQNV